MPLQSHVIQPANRTLPLDDESIKRAAHLFRVHGTLLLENCFEPALVQALHRDFIDHYANIDLETRSKTCLEVGNKRFMFTIRLQPPFLDPAVYAAPRILPIVRELLGPDCIIQSIGTVCAFPGAADQLHHFDHPALYQEAGVLNAYLPPYALHVVVPLVDLNEETGTTAVWEGSHRLRSIEERNRWTREDLAAFKGAEMPWPKKGDSYFMDFRLRHAGTANHSDEPRPILYLVYSRTWFQDRKNFDIQSPLLITREEYERIPQEHKSLFKNAQPSD